MRGDRRLLAVACGAMMGMAAPAFAWADPPLDTTMPNESVATPHGQHEHVTVRATRAAPVPKLPPVVRSMPQQAFGVGTSPVSTRMRAPADCQDSYTNVGGQPSRQADRYTPLGAESCRGH